MDQANQQTERLDFKTYEEIVGEYCFGKFIPYTSEIGRYWAKLSSAWTDSHHFHCNPFNPCGYCESNFMGNYDIVDRIAYVLRFYIRGSY